jgi:hypothetical protein
MAMTMAEVVQSDTITPDITWVTLVPPLHRGQLMCIPRLRIAKAYTRVIPLAEDVEGVLWERSIQPARVRT